MDELYNEILHETLHFSGCDAASDRLALLNYLKDVFELDDVKHIHLLEAAKAKMAPKVLLNVEVIDGTILKPTKPNGLSDPFCSLYMECYNTQRHSTSIKSDTLNPTWKEEYQIPVQNSEDDSLCIELWNFNSDKKVPEKIKKVMKGLKVLLKDVPITAAGKRRLGNKLIGKALVPLKDIPASGYIFPCSINKINKKSKTKPRGDVKLHLKFHFEKSTKAAFQEHMHLIKNVLLHEIKTSQVEPHSWNGSFSSLAEKILAQHSAQCRLPQVSVALAQWVEFSNIHLLHHPLNFNIFFPILKELITPLEEGLMTEEEKLLFWRATVMLLPSSLFNIRNIHKLSMNDKTKNEPTIILGLLHQLAELQTPEDIILFPDSIYDWVMNKENKNRCDIPSIVNEIATQGSAEWFSNITEQFLIHDSTDEEQKIKGLLNVVIMVTTALNRAAECHEMLFQKYFHFSYLETVYKLFDDRLSELIEPTVTSIWENRTPLKFNDSTEEGIYDHDPLALGSVLLELYTSLQTFSNQRHSLCNGGLDLSIPKKFHEWFCPGVIHWLCISQYKALLGIMKAVKEDKFNPVYHGTNYSSSACDTLFIFNQIKISWKQLAWPNSKASEEYANKIIYDICECLNFYADKMCQKIEEVFNDETLSDKELEVWCLAVRNMDYLQQSVQPVIAEFGVDETFDQAESIASSEDCGKTVEIVINSTIDENRNKIQETAAKKIMDTINKKLMEAFQHFDSEEKMEKLMSHLHCYLQTFHSQLDTSSFNSILNCIWKNLYYKMNEILELNLQLQREKSFFKKFHEILENFVGFFQQWNENVDLQNLSEIQHILQLNTLDTWELVHQYRLEQLTEQRAMLAACLGLLTVRMQFIEDILKIEVLNARNLQPVSSKGCCYPYVKIYFLPEKKFVGIVQPKTKTRGNTIFPLFEETFVIQLNSKQMKVENAVIMFLVKEKTYLRRNRYLGETLISFDDVPRFDGSTKFECLEQMHLKLNPPTKLDSGAFVVLEHYQERLAREFIKNRKLRKCRKKSSLKHNVQAISADVWSSIINVMSYIKKGSVKKDFLPLMHQ